MNLYEMLCNALATKNKELVESLLKNDNVDPNPALHLACIHRNHDVVRLLVGNRHNPADPNKPDVNGLTPLCAAVDSGNIEVVKILFFQSIIWVDPNQISSGSSPLTTAINKGIGRLVDMLLRAGADTNLNPTHNYLCSPIYVAIDRGNADICRMLLDFKCDVNLTSGTVHQSPVEYAARSGKHEFVKMLLATGANVTKPLLEYAVLREDVSMLESCLDRATLDNDDTLLEYCLELVYSEVGDVKHLFDGYVCARVMCSAITGDSIDCLYVLLRWGFYTYLSACRLIYPYTPLHIAVMCRSIQALTMMARIDPQCLQEDDFVKNPTINCTKFRELIEARKYPARLDILCRAKIIKQLDFSPVHKAEELPLPRILKNFMQLSDVIFPS